MNDNDLVFSGFKCKFCGGIINEENNIHYGISFVNGYPSPCKMNGSNVFDGSLDEWLYGSAVPVYSAEGQEYLKRIRNLKLN